MARLNRNVEARLSMLTDLVAARSSTPVEPVDWGPHADLIAQHGAVLIAADAAGSIHSAEAAAAQVIGELLGRPCPHDGLDCVGGPGLVARADCP